jgi:flagellin-specific chaperone FliS
VESFDYSEKIIDGKEWCFLNIENVGAIMTTKDKLEDGIYATFICHLMQASIAEDSKKIEEGLKIYKIIADEFLDGKM